MKDQLERIYSDKSRDFDLMEPDSGHFERFQAKLKAQSENRSKVIYWPWLSAAAVILIFFGIWFGKDLNPNKGLELADISPKMEETQDFFMQTIQKEIKAIEKNKTTENQKIIDDAFVQLNILERDYKKLTMELKVSNEDKRVIFAMITNFQKRIEILQNLMEKLEEIEKLKEQTNQLV
jgi:septal ring factor EnvC (AmiA/AmiB activator)